MRAKIPVYRKIIIFLPLIPAGNEPKSVGPWRMPRGSISRCLQRFKLHAPLLAAGLLTGLLALSGCRNNEDLSSDAVVNESISTGSTETENKVETEDRAELDNEMETQSSETIGSAQSQPEPSEVPVSSEALDILYHREDGIDISLSSHSCAADGENLYLVYGSAGEPDLYAMPIGADEHMRMNIDNPEGMIICHVAMDTYGKKHLLVFGKWF